MVVVRQNKNISLDKFFSILQQERKILNSGCEHTGDRAKIGEKASKNNKHYFRSCNFTYICIFKFAISHKCKFALKGDGQSQCNISENGILTLVVDIFATLDRGELFCLMSCWC